MPDERVDEDVAVVRRALKPHHPYFEEHLPREAEAALDRLQARLEAAEAERDKLRQAFNTEVRVCDARTKLCAEAAAERDEARADAERLAEALKLALMHLEDGRAIAAVRAALAAHTPHLTGPKRPPTGTTYVTEEDETGVSGFAAEDVGPPAPGEGEGYPNPELEMGPC